MFKIPIDHAGDDSDDGINKEPFIWRRVQFPLRPGFALTVNKSQGYCLIFGHSLNLMNTFLLSGQTLERVGLLLDRSQLFSHGQLYVAFSRVKFSKAIR